MLRIDADAHVLETEETWEFMDGADHKYRPEIVGTLNGSGSVDEYWLVDGTLRLKSRNVGKDTPLESRENCGTWPCGSGTWTSSRWTSRSSSPPSSSSR